MGSPQVRTNVHAHAHAAPLLLSTFPTEYDASRIYVIESVAARSDGLSAALCFLEADGVGDDAEEKLAACIASPPEPEMAPSLYAHDTPSARARHTTLYLCRRRRRRKDAA